MDYTWGIFAFLVVGLLVFDLQFMHPRGRVATFKSSLKTSIFYVSIGLLFGVWVWITKGGQSGKEYFTGFLVEKSLSFDNIFVIFLIFTHFGIPRQHQYRILFWGVLGAILLRALLIGLASFLLGMSAYVLYVFALFLIMMGAKMFWGKSESALIQESKFSIFLRKYFPYTKEINNGHFFVKQKDKKTNTLKWHMTPLFLALVVVEFIDLSFALDSVPAIFAITNDLYIVYTSNIFAILGLRALYFVIGPMVEKFSHMRYVLGVLLIFIGGKIIVPHLFEIPPMEASAALMVTLSILIGGGVYSFFAARSSKRRDAVRS